MPTSGGASLESRTRNAEFDDHAQTVCFHSSPAVLPRLRPPVCRRPTPSISAIVSNGETVGHVIAAHDGHTIDVDYAVSDNGRGPKHKEHLVLDPAGIPVEWSIEGTSLMGGTVSEHLTWKDSVEKWVSQADEGQVNTPRAQLYIGNDASPWALGLYLRVLAKAPGNTLEVLPSGRLQLKRLREVSVESGSQKISLVAWLLSGVDLTPEVLLVDKQGRLFARLSDSILVRDGYEKQYEQLKLLGSAPHPGAAPGDAEAGGALLRNAGAAA